MGTPDDSDAKSTKSMSELLGVESITGVGKTNKRKSIGKKKRNQCENFCDVTYLYFDS